MKDSEVRGLVLQKLYEVRHVKDFVFIPDELGLTDINPQILGNIAKQLDQQNLIQFSQVMGNRYPSGNARIKSFGIDVVEKTTTASIAITLDQSVNVHGSQNVQIGGQGNVQNVTMDIDKMMNTVDSSDVSTTEKEEAKSLLKKISENKLVQTALGNWIKGLGTGGSGAPSS